LPLHRRRYASKFSVIFLKPPLSKDVSSGVRIGSPVTGPGVDALQASGMAARRV
jgi:hypothetical protein